MGAHVIMPMYNPTCILNEHGASHDIDCSSCMPADLLHVTLSSFVSPAGFHSPFQGSPAARSFCGQEMSILDKRRQAGSQAPCDPVERKSHPQKAFLHLPAKGRSKARGPSKHHDKEVSCRPVLECFLRCSFEASHKLPATLTTKLLTRHANVNVGARKADPTLFTLHWLDSSMHQPHGLDVQVDRICI